MTEIPSHVFLSNRGTLLCQLEHVPICNPSPIGKPARTPVLKQICKTVIKMSVLQSGCKDIGNDTNRQGIAEDVRAAYITGLTAGVLNLLQS